MKLIKKTRSMCNTCLKTIPAATYQKGNRIFLKKECPEHDKSSHEHIWNDPEIYKGLSRIKALGGESDNAAAVLTYKCNMNCPVCYAKANETNIKDLDSNDFEKIKDFGVIFLTGGEPTVRKDVLSLIRKLTKNGKRIVMFTNGLKLADKDFARKISKAGLRHAILQLDSLDEEENKYMRGRELVEIKKKAIENLQENDVPVQTYSVMIKDKNFDEVEELYNFALKYPIVKTISVCPLWRIGRYDEKDFVSSAGIINRICKILKVKKEAWTESTRLCCNIEKLLFMLKERRRVFAKCNLRCLVLIHNGKNIPVTEVFNTRKINRKIESAYDSKSKLKLISFFIYFIFSQVVINFILNHNFRVFVWRTLKNSKYFFQKRYLMFNPFKSFVLATFPLLEQIDFDFVESCNFKCISSENNVSEPACIHRIKAIVKGDKDFE